MTDKKKPEGKVFLGAWSVPPADATDEEIDAWAEQMVSNMRDAIRKSEGKEPEAPSEEAK